MKDSFSRQTVICTTNPEIGNFNIFGNHTSQVGPVKVEAKQVKGHTIETVETYACNLD